MPALEHSRYKVHSKNQHPYNHKLSEFLYNNASAPGVINVEDALDFMFSVLYPQTLPAADTYTDLLAIAAPTLGDYVNVTDDSDGPNPSGGKTAGYMYAQYDGDLTPVWHKTTVFDWGVNDVASEMMDRTKLLYYFKQGLDDVDENGNVITGELAGQSLYGGQTADKNLNLYANNGDIVGNTGFIQFGDNARALGDLLFSLGDSSHRFKDIYTGSIYIGTGTLTITSDANGATISDSSKKLDMADNEIKTTGDAIAGKVVVDDITIDNNVIKSASGSTAFGGDSISDINALTAGEVRAGLVATGDTTMSDGQITDLNGELFMNIDLVRFKEFVQAQSYKATDAIEEVVVDKNSITSNTDVTFDTSKVGGIFTFLKDIVTQAITGTIATFNKVVVDDITIDANEIDVASDLFTLKANPVSGVIRTRNKIIPVDSNVLDLGASGSLFRNAYLSGSIHTATKEFVLSELMKLRAASTGAVAGDCLFYDATTSTWLPSAPDSEIEHADLNNLVPAGDNNDSGHTQFVMLNGRSLGQSIVGGISNTETLSLRAYRGSKFVNLTNDAIYPSLAGEMTLGTSGNAWGNLYGIGQIFGYRTENVSVLPAGHLDKIGKLYWNTSDDGLYANTGTETKRVGLVTYKGTFDETQILAAHNVAPITDAMDAIWQLKDSTGEVLGVTITVTNTQEVTISSPMTLAPGDYRLIGVQA